MATDGLQTNAKAGTSAQIGTEASPMAGGSADKALASTMITLATTAEFTERKGEGRKFHNSVKLAQEASEGTWEGPGSYTEMLYPCEGVFNKVTPTSLGSGAYSRLYWMNNATPDTLATYIVQKGNTRSGMNKQWRGVYFNGFEFTASKSEVAHTSPIRGIQLEFPDIMTATPTEVAQVDIDPNEGDLYYSLISLADLDVAPVQILRGFNFGFSLGNRANEFYAINSTLRSYTGTVESTNLDPQVTLRLGSEVNAPLAWQATTAYTLGQVRRRVTGSGLLVFRVTTAGTSGASEPTWPTTVGGTVVDGTVTWTAQLRDYSDPLTLDAMRKGSGKLIFLRYKAQGPLIGGGFYNLWQVDVCCAVNQAPGDEDENELLVNAWQMRPIPDPADGSKRPFLIKSISPIATV
jgi:hypothetical protein